MRHRLLLAATLLVAGCGSASSGAVRLDAGACLAIAAETFCSASSPCCAGAYCDPVNTRCRDASRCGVNGEGCDPSHPCCSDQTCFAGSCSGQAGPTSGGGTTASTTAGGCHGVSQTCSTDVDCCSGHCATGNHLCAASTTGTTGNTSSSTTTGATTGGTCSSAGTACASTTECCSHVCNSGLCG